MDLVVTSEPHVGIMILGGSNTQIKWYQIWDRWNYILPRWMRWWQLNEMAIKT